jgi:MMPL family
VLAIVAGGGSSGGPIRDVGVGLALGILMDTFLVRTLLVPSTVVLLGRWNWWPSRMSRAHAHPDATPPPAVPGLDEAHGEPGNGQPERLKAADPPA